MVTATNHERRRIVVARGSSIERPTASHEGGGKVNTKKNAAGAVRGDVDEHS